eukprot:TRINITY_DN178_c0_g1_i1.p1 TRINITY_DN178_c0_g1~~TRINITY_DN178_c0_g1_i1.p1  ORF type:complete len:164 (+),score=50.13 TRINITY_DN178_c0_g1_i1:184-675(+)
MTTHTLPALDLSDLHSFASKGSRGGGEMMMSSSTAPLLATAAEGGMYDDDSSEEETWVLNFRGKEIDDDGIPDDEEPLEANQRRRGSVSDVKGGNGFSGMLMRKSTSALGGSSTLLTSQKDEMVLSAEIIAASPILSRRRKKQAEMAQATPRAPLDRPLSCKE